MLKTDMQTFCAGIDRRIKEDVGAGQRRNVLRSSAKV